MECASGKKRGGVDEKGSIKVRDKRDGLLPRHLYTTLELLPRIIGRLYTKRITTQLVKSYKIDLIDPQSKVPIRTIHEKLDGTIKWADEYTVSV